MSPFAINRELARFSRSGLSYPANQQAVVGELRARVVPVASSSCSAVTLGWPLALTSECEARATKSTSIGPAGITLGTSPPDASEKRRTKKREHFDATHTWMPALRVCQVGLPRVAKSEYLCEASLVPITYRRVTVELYPFWVLNPQ